MSELKIRVAPVTNENWDAFARFFETGGGPHYCWCTLYRVRNAPELTRAEKKACMRTLVDSDVPIGVLACQGDEPIGWCSIAPRETYVRLEKSRTMPRVTSPGASTWTVLCFFVARPYRGRHVAKALLNGAVAYARERGGEVIEGYPFDTAGISSHRGHSRIFKSARVRIDGKRWFRRLGRSHGAGLPGR